MHLHCIRYYNLEISICRRGCVSLYWNTTSFYQRTWTSTILVSMGVWTNHSWMWGTTVYCFQFLKCDQLHCNKYPLVRSWLIYNNISFIITRNYRSRFKTFIDIANLAFMKVGSIYILSSVWKAHFLKLTLGLHLKNWLSKIKYCFTYSLVIYISSFLDYTSYPCLIFLNILLVFPH